MEKMPTFRAREDGFYELASNWMIETSVGVIFIRRGFVTDGASVPRMAWFLAGPPMESPRVLAALAHDWLYAAHVTSRKEADEIYREILLRVRAKWRVEAEYLALRAFGGKSWSAADADEIEFARKRGAFVRQKKRKQ